MKDIWKLIILSHRRKKNIFGLIAALVGIALLIPLLNSISLGQGAIVNQSFQHLIIEIVGILFILYFWSTLLKQFQENKTLQLLRSKKKEPIQFIIGARLGTYTVYGWFIVIAMITSLLFYGDISLIISYSNLLISGAIALSLIFFFSSITNSYAALLSTLIVYLISYSINFIIFSTPVNFEDNISFKILTIVQHLFPRFDILYSSMSMFSTWLRSVGANILYFICITSIMIYIFLSRFAKR